MLRVLVSSHVPDDWVRVSRFGAWAEVRVEIERWAQTDEVAQGLVVLVKISYGTRSARGLNTRALGGDLTLAFSDPNTAFAYKMQFV